MSIAEAHQLPSTGFTILAPKSSGQMITVGMIAVREGAAKEGIK